MLKRLSSGLAHSIPRLRVSFSKRPDDNDDKGDQRPKYDSKSKPELSDFDKANFEEIQKQTRDTKEPFKVQRRDPKLLGDRTTKLNLKQFDLLKDSEMPNDVGLNRPKGVMDITDPRVQHKPGILQVHGLFRNTINVSSMIINSGAILLTNMVFSWDITSPEDIRPYHFDVLNYLKPKPSKKGITAGYILVGTGSDKFFLDDDCINKLKSFGIKFDVVDSVGSDFKKSFKL